jgi:hypothetical protein
VPSGNHAKRKWITRIRFTLLVLFGFGSILTYALLAITINGQPPYEKFPGWMAIVQSDFESTADKVTLHMESNAAGNDPHVIYTVAVCGPSPYSGDLLLGGKARLSDVYSYSISPSSIPYLNLKVENLKDLTITYEFRSIFDLGAAQLVPIKLDHIPPCPTSQPGFAIGQFGGGGAAIGIEGYISSPIEQRWSAPWGLWHGPNSTDAWPLVGSLPDIPSGNLGIFTSGSILPGSWMMPAQEGLTVNADDVPLTSNVTATLPASSEANTLAWSSFDPVNPMARITDSSAMEDLQQWLVAAGIGLGIGGGLLASLAFDWLRQSDDQHVPVAPTTRPHECLIQPPPKQYSARQNIVGPAAIGTILFTAALAIRWVLRSRGGSPPR